MGFMEGFANSFGRQMEIGQEQRETRKRDAFQLSYDKYMKDRSEYDKALSEDTKLVNSAKAITSSVAGAPEGAWEHAYTWLQSGYTPLQVEEKLRTTQFASQEQPAMSDSPQTAQATDKISDQTAESGLAPGQAETTGQQDPDLMGSVLGAGGLLDPAAIEQRYATNAQNQVIQGAGIDRAEFDKVSAGYQPTKLSGNAPAITGTIGEAGNGIDQTQFAKDQAIWVIGTGKDGTKFQTQALQGNDGNWYGPGNRLIEGEIERTITNEEMRAMDAALDYVNKSTEALREEKVATMQMANEGLNLVELAQNNPNVLASSTAVSTVFNDLTNELSALGSQVGGFLSPEAQQAEQRALQAISSNFANTDQNSSDANLFNSMKVKFVFSLARVMSGPGVLSENDVAQAANLLKTSDPAEFARQMQSLIENGVVKYDNLAQTTMQMDLGVDRARQRGIPVDELFGPILESLPQDQQDFLGDESIGQVPQAGTQPTAQQEQATEGTGEVISSGTITADMIANYPEGYLTEEDIGRPYREFANGIEFLD